LNGTTFAQRWSWPSVVGGFALTSADHPMATEPETPRFRLRRRRYVVVGVLTIAVLLTVGELIRRESRRRWLESEVASIGGGLEDFHEDETWGWKFQFWWRYGEYPRRRMLYFTRRVDPEWLREHDYLRGLDATELQFGEGSVAGDDLAQLIEAQPLNSLHLIDEELSARTLAAIARKRRWKHLQLSGCNLSDEVFRSFDLSRIQFLAIDSTGVTSEGLSVLTRCECLDHAMLGGGQISSQVARQLAALGTLKRLELVGKAVTGADIELTSMITSLESLDLVNTPGIDSE